MTRTLSERAIADRVGIDVDRVREFAALGIIVPGDGDQPYSARDVMRAEVAVATERAGVSAEDLAEAIATGALSLSYLDALPEPAALLDVTGGDLAEQIGTSFETIQALFGAFGLPVPSPQDRVREDDAFVYRAASVYAAIGMDEMTLVGAARVYGEVFHRLAQFQVDLFHTEFERPQRDAGVSERELLDRAIADTRAAGSTAGLGTQLVGYLYERHSEGRQIQHRLEHAERALEEAGVFRRRVVDPPAVAFLDLSGYTALTEARGDVASADVAIRLAAAVEDPVRRHRGHLVKWLGDGVEMYFERPADGVVCCLELVGAVHDADLPPAHIGINVGPVVYRGGDYYGSTVNVASRIAGIASANEVLVSDSVIEACRETPLRFESRGEHPVKGLSAPLHLSAAR